MASSIEQLHTPPTLHDRSLLLDVLRIFAASWVVVFHWTRSSWFAGAPEPIVAFAQAGYLGVDVFFMLSGAVIAYTALGRTWSSFAITRFLRLFPAFFAATVLVGALLIWRGVLDPSPASWLNLTGLNFFIGEEPYVSVAWTLFYEVMFYVLIGVLILVSRNHLTEDRIRKGAMVFLLVALFATFSSNTELTILTISGFGGMFALGALLGISRTREQLQRNLPGIVIAAGLAYFKLTQRTEPMESEAAIIGWSAGIVLVVGAVILWSAMRPSRIRSMRLRNVVTTVSLMTYPMYLIHLDLGIGLVQVAQKAGVSAAIAGVGSAILMVVLSWLSVIVYEPWARRRLRSWFGWKDAGKRTAPPEPKPVEESGGNRDEPQLG